MPICVCSLYTDKKQNKIFLIYKEIKRDHVKLYMTNGPLIYGEKFAPFLIYLKAFPHTLGSLPYI
jgi:hypothetical protein